jgi:hypothetical protein
MIAKILKDVIELAETWPEENQLELAADVREIEARRTGVYHATPEELKAIDEADSSGVATDEEVEAAFAPHELSAEDREALSRSAEDVRQGRFATDDQVKATFDRYRHREKPKSDPPESMV